MSIIDHTTLKWTLISWVTTLKVIFSILKPNEGLTCLNFNIRSLPKPYVIFTNDFECFSLDVVSITETLLNFEQELLYLLDGYGQFCVSRKNKKGGGISLHVNDQIFTNVFLTLNVIL